MLRIESLSAGYGESRVLREVSLDVPRGRIVCLMGRNGVGKTTLLKSVMGLLPAWSGRVRLDGEDVTAWSPDARARRGLGYVPQGREIFASLTVEENLLVGLEAMANRRAAIPEEVFELFPALRSMRRRRGGDLSGGQQQQLAFARALVGRPKVLLLDEPTEGIQPSIIIQIEEGIERLKARGDLSILLVEQYVEFAARLADDFAIMERGAIVAKGATRDLNEDVIRRHLVV